jgi:hypothetical protein
LQATLCDYIFCELHWTGFLPKRSGHYPIFYKNLQISEFSLRMAFAAAGIEHGSATSYG